MRQAATSSISVFQPALQWSCPRSYGEGYASTLMPKKKKTQGATQSPKVVSLWHKDPFRPWKKPIFVIYDIRKLA